MKRTILAAMVLAVIFLALPAITAGGTESRPLASDDGPKPAISDDAEGSPEPEDEAESDRNEDKKKRIADTAEMLEELLRQLKEFWEPERPDPSEDYSDILKRFREMLERLKRESAALELRDSLTIFGELFVEAFLEGRDFHYDLKLGETEYRINAMNRHGVRDLGLKVENISPALEAQLGLEGKGGVLITEVEEGGTAAKAGLRKHDVLVSIGGSDVPGIDKIENILGALPVEKELTCKVIRNAKAKEIKMTLPKGFRSGEESDKEEEEEEEEEAETDNGTQND